MRAVAALGRGRRIAVIRILDRGEVAGAGGEVADPVDPAVELAVRAAHAGVNHIGVDTGAVGAGSEAAVERQSALIDPVEAPWDCACRLQQHRRKQQAANGGHREPKVCHTRVR